MDTSLVRLARLVLCGSLVLFTGCEDVGDERPCCTPPTVETTVSFQWTVGGRPAAEGCLAAGATSVRTEVMPSRDPVVTEHDCAAGSASVRAVVFQPALGTSSAGGALVRLLDADGREITSRAVALEWQSGRVGAALDLVPPTAGTSVRYRWCTPLPQGSGVVVTAHGPLYLEAAAISPASEVVLGPLAPGHYTLSLEAAFGQPLIGPAAKEVAVTAGEELLVEVLPCPLR